ncbi:MAG TPA: metal-sulfur cluster assembly factor [Mycobacteriales bacterium]
MTEEPLRTLAFLTSAPESDQLRELLRDVIDPELGVDIVSLGLVYRLEVTDRVADVLITTTTPACPLGSYLVEEIERALAASGAVDRVQVEITHTPPWTPDRMTGSTRRAFGWS